ncbi:hypothetical protein P7228_14975 [Altererythrobacter arenosus]|uniref:Secreted protein n=1 Tax=Altererythrobacter arenosus TaxID=3032592 RepID=A0ABY8FR83_9SPHN|nr:hypothetical protein [Altererythrobacter sp. CAU 1644]WFL77272.1 hypothetical protein P7228_14975 [Altererythrobacter sp. CAU 1644]
MTGRTWASAAASILLLLTSGCVMDEGIDDQTVAATEEAPTTEPATKPPTEVVSAGMPALPEVGGSEHGYSPTEESKCLAQGGTYERRGMMGLYSCAVPYPDAGKVCRKASDCEGQCRIEDGQADPSVGKCQANTDNFGCYTYLGDKGEVLGICVD